MRIAVSQADLNSGRFSAISKSLAKAWPHGKLSLMQVQGKLAQPLRHGPRRACRHQGTQPRADRATILGLPAQAERFLKSPGEGARWLHVERVSEDRSI